MLPLRLAARGGQLTGGVRVEVILMWLGSVLFLVFGGLDPGDSLSGRIGLLCVGAVLLTLAGLETFVWSRKEQKNGRDTEESKEEKEAEHDNNTLGKA